MRRPSPIPTLALCAVLGGPLGAQRLGDFVLPTDADDPAATRRVASPDAVTVTENAALERPVVAGRTEQDAINHAVATLEETGGGARFIATASGVGLVASSSERYRTDFENPNLVLRDQRRAWVVAHLEAKAKLVRALEELSLEGKLFLVEQKLALDDVDGSRKNVEREQRERIRELVGGFLRGAVTYDVADDPERGEVRVSVVTTPLTQGQVSADSYTDVTAESLATGVEYVLREVRLGVVPPTGARTIVVPSTGHVAWIGFGSALAAYHDDPELAADNRDDAAEIARARADRALLAALRGEEIEASTSYEEHFEAAVREFEVLIAENGDESVRDLGERQRSALTSTALEAKLGSTAVGELPRGIQEVSSWSDDGRWAYCVAFWSSDAGEAARELRDTMLATGPLGDTARRRTRYEVESDGTFVRAPDGRLLPRSLGRGRVTRDEDL